MSHVVLPALWWWLAVTLTGVAAFPLARRLFPAHPGLALGFARPIGLLLAAYLWWLGAISSVVPAGRAGAWSGVLAVIAAGAFVGWRDRAVLADCLRARRRLVVGLELLFGLTLMIWAVYRSFNPDITQAGGEKTMEMAFINAILESPRFPPRDPWMSGESISYYYFGFVIAAQLVHISGVDRFIAFNLIVPMTLGLTLAGAFALGHTLAELTPGTSVRLRVATGALTAAALALLGNLSGALEVAYKAGWLPEGFFRWLDVRELGVDALVCNADNAQYNALDGLTSLRLTDYLPSRFMWWWRGSRIIHDGCGEVIHEFPFFSFMLADAHPHVMALPYVLLVLALALAVLAGGLPRLPGRPPLAPAWLALPLVLGALAFLNTWDMPAYGFVLVTAFVLWRTGAWYADAAPDASPRTIARDVFGFAVWLVGLAVLLYLPFHLGFRSQASGFGLAAYSSRAPQWLVHFGVLAFLALSTLVMVAARRPAGARLQPPTRAWLLVSGTVGAMALARWTAVGLRPAATGQWTPWLPAALVLAVVAAGAVLLEVWYGARPAIDAPRAAPPVAETFATLCIATGLLLAAGTEFVFIRDLFSSRMNTVFKLFYQAWVLLSIGGGYAACLAWSRLSRRGAMVWSGAASVLVALALVYPLGAVWNRTDGFRLTYLRQAREEGAGLGPWLAPLTLDGLAYWDASYPGDRAAARWLADNAPTGTTLLEASGGSYGHAGRIALATGIPTVLGADWHEVQWRGSDAEVNRRKADVKAFYSGDLDDKALLAMLERYDVRYVVVGDLEAGTYGASSALEQRLGRLLALVFDERGTRIYARR